MVSLVIYVFLVFLTFHVYAKYDPSWSSLDTRPIPDWYVDAKFGIFIHWGVYSVPAWAPVGSYAEWYWHDLVSTPNSSTASFHNKTYGEHFKYTDFVNNFNAELFNATEWAELFYKSGAKYVVPTSKHHEGYTLWASAQSWNWNSVDQKPHIDLAQQLTTAIRSVGLHAGFYYSLYEWFHPLYIGPNPSEYVEQIMIPQLKDLVNTYKPDLVWTDGEWDYPSSFWQSESFLAWLFNDSPVADVVVVNDRWGNETRGKHGGIYTAEYDSSIHLDHVWEENSGIDIHSFGLNRATPADKYWSSSYLLNLLVRCVSNNGNFLLDIGPSSDGTIPSIMQSRLLDIGGWLSVNGESIYGSRAWRVQYEPQSGNIDDANVRYTRSNRQDGKNETIYAHVLAIPPSFVISLSAPIVSPATTVTLLDGTDESPVLPFVAGSSGAGLSFDVPRLNPSLTKTAFIWVFKIQNAQ